MVLQKEFINNSLLAIGERPYMQDTLVSNSQKAAYQCFVEAVSTMTHAYEWSFLQSSAVPTVRVNNVVTVPKFQRILSVKYVRTLLTNLYLQDLVQFDSLTTVGSSRYFVVNADNEILLYPIPTTLSSITVYFIKEFILTPYSSFSLLGFPIKFESVLKKLLNSMLCKQLLDDLESYNAFMQEYTKETNRMFMKDRESVVGKPNMFRLL